MDIYFQCAINEDARIHWLATRSNAGAIERAGDLPFVVSLSNHSFPCEQTIVLTRRSTSLPSFAGRCAIKPRSAGYLWQQIIDHAKTKGRPVVLVTSKR